jgi:hypothetical protein
MRRLLLTPAALANPPRPALELGVHWPSEITEDPTSPLNDLQLFTFYTMESRADAVGKNLVYSLLRIALNARGTQAFRLFLLGHSFGCKVMCAALQDIQQDIANGTIPIDPQTTWKVVLLEPATDWDNLEPNDIYGNVGKIANLRMLVTTSQLDKALTVWFPKAAQIANLFHGGNPTPALGAAGPSQATVNYFGGASNLSIAPGFAMQTAATAGGKLIVADLTPVHTARASAGTYNGGVSGSHSDIYFDEVYNLVGGFLYSSP